MLASASPARRATLLAAGVPVLVRVSRVDEAAEVAARGLRDPGEICLLLARAKAEDVAGGTELPDEALVLGCDSVLDLDGEAFGKPRDAAEATLRWKAMRGRSGVLRTGHWLVDLRREGSGGQVGGTSDTVVHFADITDAEIEAYVATGEPLAVAGSFTLDGYGGAFVTGIEGDPHGVVGVSLPLLRELCGQLGVAWTDLWATPGGR